MDETGSKNPCKVCEKMLIRFLAAHRTSHNAIQNTVAHTRNREKIVMLLGEFVSELNRAIQMQNVCVEPSDPHHFKIQKGARTFLNIRRNKLYYFTLQSNKCTRNLIHITFLMNPSITTFYSAIFYQFMLHFIRI